MEDRAPRCGSHLWPVWPVCPLQRADPAPASPEWESLPWVSSQVEDQG